MLECTVRRQDGIVAREEVGASVGSAVSASPRMVRALTPSPSLTGRDRRWICATLNEVALEEIAEADIVRRVVDQGRRMSNIRTRRE